MMIISRLCCWNALNIYCQILLSVCYFIIALSAQLFYVISRILFLIIDGYVIKILIIRSAALVALWFDHIMLF